MVCSLSSSAYSDVTLTAWNVHGWEYLHQVAIVVHSLSHVQLCDPMHCSRPGFPVHHSSWSWLTLKSIESVMPFNHLILCRLLLLCRPSFPALGSFPVNWLFASCGQSIGASASASVLPVNNSGLISLRIDWLDLLAVQVTLKNLLQHHSSKASILQCSTFFMVQLSHP